MAGKPEAKTVVGIFEDRVDAEAAIEELQQAGFTEEQTGYIVRGKKDPGDDESPVENDAQLNEEYTGAGVLGGGTVGGVIGAAATGLIPGIGPVIAVGALAGVLGGAAVGGVAGGVAGTLAGKGVPEDEAKIYEDEFKAGRPVVVVEGGERRDEAKRILENHGAYDAHSRRA